MGLFDACLRNYPNCKKSQKINNIIQGILLIPLLRDLLLECVYISDLLARFEPITSRSEHLSSLYQIDCVIFSYLSQLNCSTGLRIFAHRKFSFLNWMKQFSDLILQVFNFTVLYCKFNIIQYTFMS